MDILSSNTPQNKTTFIYALVDPNIEQIRYVGKSNNPQKRFQQHLRDTKDTTYKARWINSLKSQNQIPTLLILEEVSYEQWQERERYWIAYYREQDAHLVNLTNGGEGIDLTPEGIAKRGLAMRGRVMTPEQRAKISKTLTGRKQPPEVIAKVAAKNRGRKRHSDAIAKMVAASRGRKHSPESRARMSESQQRAALKKTPEQIAEFQKRTQTPESRAARGAKHRGKIISPEQRDKLSKAHKARLEDPEERAAFINRMNTVNRGRKHSPEEIERVRQANIGRKQSEETRAKMRARWAERKANWTEEDHEKCAKGGRKVMQQRGTEYNKRLGEANRGRKHSEEARARMSQSQKGKIVSEESRAKMRAAWQHRREAKLQASGQMTLFDEGEEHGFYQSG